MSRHTHVQVLDQHDIFLASDQLRQRKNVVGMPSVTRRPTKAESQSSTWTTYPSTSRRPSAFQPKTNSQPSSSSSSSFKPNVSRRRFGTPYPNAAAKPMASVVVKTDPGRTSVKTQARANPTSASAIDPNFWEKLAKAQARANKTQSASTATSMTASMPRVSSPNRFPTNANVPVTESTSFNKANMPLKSNLKTATGEQKQGDKKVNWRPKLASYQSAPEFESSSEAVVEDAPFTYQYQPAPSSSTDTPTPSTSRTQSYPVIDNVTLIDMVVGYQLRGYSIDKYDPARQLRLPCNTQTWMPNANKNRWDYISKTFLSRDVRRVADLEAIIRSYRRDEQDWPNPFTNLTNYAARNRNFLNDTLPFIISCAVDIQRVFDRHPLLLQQGMQAEIQFTESQVLSLIANMFLCTFEHDAVPRNVKPGYPRNLTMERWFIDDNRVNLAKIACLVAYFEYHRTQRAAILMEEGIVKVRRQVLDPQQVYPWSTSSSAMLNVQVNANNTIESIRRSAHTDFANALIGGGVLGNGAVQEEIRMCISPELLVSLLITQQMADNEAVVISGSHIYAKYTGYAKSFAFQDAYRIDGVVSRSEPHVVIAFDALDYSKNVIAQWSSTNIDREIQKAFIAFTPKRGEMLPIATGHWGAGVFGGYRSLKFVIQWLAASAAGRNLTYCMLGDVELQSEVNQFMLQISRAPKVYTVGDVYTALKLVIRDADLNGLGPDNLLSLMRRMLLRM